MTTTLDLHRSCWDPARRVATAEAASASGFVRRSLWAEEWKRRRETAPSCRVCDRLWTPRTGVLHDVLIASRRPTRFDDLLPFCVAHHESLHDQIDATRRSSVVDHRRATYDALCALQRRHRDLTTA